MRSKRVTVTGANILFFIFVVIFLSFQLVLGFINGLLGGELVKNYVYGMLFINEYIFILLPVLIFAIIKKLDFKAVFRFNRLGILPAILIILSSFPAYFVASMLNSFVVYVLQFIGDIPANTIPVPKSVGEFLLGLLIVAVSPAVCEEMLNRGIMLKAYENRGSIKAVVITAIFFGIFHFDITNLLGPVFLGLLISYYAIRTNSIFAAMLAHFMNNAIAEVLGYLFQSGAPEPEKITISLEELGGSVLYGIAGLMFLSALLYFFKRITERTAVLRVPISGVRKDLVSIVSHWPVAVVLILYVLIAAMYILTMIASRYHGL